MAVVSRKGKKNETTTNNKSENPIRWGKANLSLWDNANKSTILSLTAIKETYNDKFYSKLEVKIENLDENGKKIKTEDDKYDCGRFNLSWQDITKVVYVLRKMITASKKFPCQGVLINRINSESNDGSQFEIINDDDGVRLNILIIKGGDIINEYSHLINNNQDIEYYNGDGEQDVTNINLDLFGLCLIFEGSVALMSGVGAGLASLWGSNGGSNSGGKINGGRTVGNVGSKLANLAGMEDDEEEEAEDTSEEESEEEEVEEEVPKKTVKKSAVPAKKSTGNTTKPVKKSMKDILNDED